MLLLRRVLREVCSPCTNRHASPRQSGLLFVITEDVYLARPRAGSPNSSTENVVTTFRQTRLRTRTLRQDSAFTRRTHATQQPEAQDARRSEEAIRQCAARRAARCQDQLASFHHQEREQARAIRERHTRAVSQLPAQAALELDPPGSADVAPRGAAHCAGDAAHHPAALGRRAEAGAPSPDVCCPSERPPSVASCTAPRPRRLPTPPPPTTNCLSTHLSAAAAPRLPALPNASPSPNPNPNPNPHAAPRQPTLLHARAALAAARRQDHR